MLVYLLEVLGLMYIITKTSNVQVLTLQDEIHNHTSTSHLTLRPMFTGFKCQRIINYGMSKTIVTRPTFFRDLTIDPTNYN